LIEKADTQVLKLNLLSQQLTWMREMCLPLVGKAQNH